MQMRMPRAIRVAPRAVRLALGSAKGSSAGPVRDESVSDNVVTARVVTPPPSSFQHLEIEHLMADETRQPPTGRYW